MYVKGAGCEVWRQDRNAAASCQQQPRAHQKIQNIRRFEPRQPAQEVTRKRNRRPPSQSMIRKWNTQNKSADHIEQIHSAIAVFRYHSQRISSSLARSLGLCETVEMIENHGRNRDESET